MYIAVDCVTTEKPGMNRRRLKTALAWSQFPLVRREKF